MYPAQTFELRIGFPKALDSVEKTKDLVKTWLKSHNVDIFVEGIVDNIELDPVTDEPLRDLYAEQGGDRSPISIFKFEAEVLSTMKSELEQSFGEELELSLLSHSTSEWVDGWKDSFKPILTEKFFIYPPWEKEAIPAGKIPLEIEPAMAFGTGQHATTVLCVKRLEKIAEEGVRGATRDCPRTCADIGTGTGILAIAMAKLGYSLCLGTDIDADSITAAKMNAEINNVDLELFLGSIPETTATYDVVVANILAHVIIQMMPKLSTLVCHDGGHLVLSGLLVENEPEIIDCCTAYGLELCSRDQLQGWSCLAFKKNLPQ